MLLSDTGTAKLTAVSLLHSISTKSNQLLKTMEQLDLHIKASLLFSFTTSSHLSPEQRWNKKKKKLHLEEQLQLLSLSDPLLLKKQPKDDKVSHRYSQDSFCLTESTNS